MHYERWNELDWWGLPPRMHRTKSMMTSDNLSDQPLSEGDETFIIGFYDKIKN